MISDRLWRSRFDADPNVLERTIRLGDPVGFPYAIVGVLPASFRFPDRDVDVWFPNFTNYAESAKQKQLCVLRRGWAPARRRDDRRGPRGPRRSSRLASRSNTRRPIATSASARRPLDERIVGAIERLPVAAVRRGVLLLLIACTNIAALLLARAARARTRGGASAIRSGRRAVLIAAQMMTETGVLVSAGATAGIALAYFAAARLARSRRTCRGSRRFRSTGAPWCIASASAVVVALLCRLFPAVRNGAAPHAGPSGPRASSRGQPRWALVGVQVALVGDAARRGRVVAAQLRSALARRPRLRIRARANVPRQRQNFDDANIDGSARIKRTLDELRGLPGVERRAASRYLCRSGRAERGRESTSRALDAKTDPLITEFRIVSPSYFETMRSRSLTGEMCR